MSPVARSARQRRSSQTFTNLSANDAPTGQPARSPKTRCETVIYVGDIAIGNAVGSNIFNILAIVGVSALVGPLRMGAIKWLDLAVMLTVSLILVQLVITRRKLERWEGAFLLVIYFLYMLVTVQKSGLG